MGEYWNLDRLTSEWQSAGLSRRRLLQLVAAGAGATALTELLAVRGAVAKQGSDGAQVRVLWRKPVTLHPLFSTSGNEQQVERLMFGSLVKMSADLVPTPDLAESVDVSDDATVFTFHLRRNIAFSDSTPLTAKDVVFTLERALDERVGSIWRGRLSGIAGAAEYGSQQAETVSGISTPDDYTVVITLAAPDAAFLPTLCNFSGLGILPSHVLQDVAPDQLQQHAFSLAPTVTAGAFKFVRYETDQFLELERNTTYFGDAPPLERIFFPILTPDVGLAQLETGEIDLMTLPVSEAERAQGIEGVTVVSVPSPSVDFLAVNLSRPHLQNKLLRQAMMHAIDRQGIVTQILQGEGTVVNSSIIGPEWMGIPEGLNEYPYDVDQAKALLDESGFDTSQTIEIMNVPGNKEHDSALAIMQQQLTEIGLKVEILQVDAAELNRRYIQENDFDLFYNAGGVFRADPNISRAYFHTVNFTPAGGNGSHYSNPQVDELFDQGQAALDQTERQRIYTELAKILNDELPWIFLWSPNSVYGLRDRLQGYVAPSYSDNKLWNAETWSVTE